MKIAAGVDGRRIALEDLWRRSVMKALFISWFSCCISACVLAGPTISVNDLLPSNVKGRLGKPLGTRTTIEGHYTSAMLANPFKVTRIDGAAATNNVVISIRSKILLKEGVSYRFEGYESGEFESAPEWLSPAAQQPFQFYSFFVVTSSPRGGDAMSADELRPLSTSQITPELKERLKGICAGTAITPSRPQSSRALESLSHFSAWRTWQPVEPKKIADSDTAPGTYFRKSNTTP